MAFILSALWWMKIRGLCKLPDGKDWLWGDLGLALVGRTKVNQSLIQFSVSLQSSFLLMGGDVFPLASGETIGGNGSIMPASCTSQDCCQCPWPHSRPPLTHAYTRDSNTHRQVWFSLLRGCSFLLGPDVHKAFFMPANSLCFPSPVEVL